MPRFCSLAPILWKSSHYEYLKRLVLRHFNALAETRIDAWRTRRGCFPRRSPVLLVPFVRTNNDNLTLIDCLGCGVTEQKCLLYL